MKNCFRMDEGTTRNGHDMNGTKETCGSMNTECKRPDHLVIDPPSAAAGAAVGRASLTTEPENGGSARSGDQANVGHGSASRLTKTRSDDIFAGTNVYGEGSTGQGTESFISTSGANFDDNCSCPDSGRETVVRRRIPSFYEVEAQAQLLLSPTEQDLANVSTRLGSLQNRCSKRRRRLDRLLSVKNNPQNQTVRNSVPDFEVEERCDKDRICALANVDNRRFSFLDGELVYCDVIKSLPHDQSHDGIHEGVTTHSYDKECGRCLSVTKCLQGWKYGDASFDEGEDDRSLTRDDVISSTDAPTGKNDYDVGVVDASIAASVQSMSAAASRLGYVGSTVAVVATEIEKSPCDVDNTSRHHPAMASVTGYPVSAVHIGQETDDKLISAVVNDVQTNEHLAPIVAPSTEENANDDNAEQTANRNYRYINSYNLFPLSIETALRLSNSDEEGTVPNEDGKRATSNTDSGCVMVSFESDAEAGAYGPEQDALPCQESSYNTATESNLEKIVIESQDLLNHLNEDALDTICTAIQSLDSLNEQIVSFIYSPRTAQLDVENDFAPKDREALKSSMSIMRRLLVDAQVRFRKMVEDNRKLASRIDSCIQSANKEMFMLRQELDDTNKRLMQIRDYNVMYGGKVKRSSSHLSSEYLRKTDADNQIIKLREENAKLELELSRLRKEVGDLRAAKNALSDQPCLTTLKIELLQYQNELVRAKEALQAMKSDRKRLKAEKLDLLGQMKMLYQTLEDKESELRDFIRRYEQQGLQTDQTMQQLEESEREKWSILARARDAAEKAVQLKTELDSKEFEIKQLRKDLTQAHKHIRELKSTVQERHHPKGSADLGISSGTELQTPSSEYLSYLPESPPPHFATSTKSVQEQMELLSLSMLTKESERVDTNLTTRTHSAEDVSVDGAKTKTKLRKKKTSFGSLSRLFGRPKNRRSIAIGEFPTLEDASPVGASPFDVLCADNVNQKLEMARRLSAAYVTDWSGDQVLAWLEMTMNMAPYGAMCARNIRSGRVIAEMTDSELETALDMHNYMHRKKLRLALHDLKNPRQIQFARASEMDHIWVCEVWIPDLGLTQYRSVFDANLVDGRVLSALTKQELEKHFQISNKLHQTSIITAIELLRRLDFDKEVLIKRRAEGITIGADPITWTNEQWIEWSNQLGLQEYSTNLRGTGVHGALLVLDVSFTAESMAAALAIPTSKTQLRKRLTEALDALIKPARNVGSGVGKAFERSFRASGEESSKKRLTLRGSLGRAFGRKVKQSQAERDDTAALTSEKRSHSHELIAGAGASI